MISPMPYSSFSLVLMVNRACNLRCTYCYTGLKIHSPMPFDTGCEAIESAMRAVEHGGQFSLGFAGGEPLLEPVLIQAFMTHARTLAAPREIAVSFSLTTNGTINHCTARRILLDPDMSVSISCDGTPGAHDTHRVTAGGQGSAAIVAGTVRMMIARGRTPSVVMVLRPDTLDRFSLGVRYLYQLGVTQLRVSVDLSAEWTGNDFLRLETGITATAEFLSRSPGRFRVSILDDSPEEPSASVRTVCDGGQGQLAISPEGDMYSHERELEDSHGPDSLCLGNMDSRDDFLSIPGLSSGRHHARSESAARSLSGRFSRMFTWFGLVK